MAKYLISKSLYDDIIEKILSQLFKNSELKSVDRDDSPWIYDEVTLNASVSGKVVEFRYVSYMESKVVDGVKTWYHTDTTLMLPEPVVIFVSRMTKVRQTKAIDAITNWFEETYDKPIDSVFITDRKYDD
jgi:hypothetical protein